MSITIVGMGPGAAGDVTRDGWQTIVDSQQLLLRTRHHPVVAEFPESTQFESFDHLYESAAEFRDVYETIVAQILARGAESEIVYAVPGHPFVGEATVLGIVQGAKEAQIPVRIVPGISFVEPMLSALEIDGLDGLQLFDALDIVAHLVPPLNSDTPTLIGQVYSRMVASELKLTLMALFADEHEVVLIHRAGLPNEQLERVPLYAIDRSEETSYLTSLFVPPRESVSSLPAFAESIAVLRGPNGCPWDQEQTPQSMRNGLLEETAELLDALDRDDVDNIREELGDVLLHVVMQAQMASEAGDFNLADVIADVDAKIKYRHPHVWGDVDVAGSEEVIANWEALKAAKKPEAPSSRLDNIPHALPALARAQKIQGRAAKAGFDWSALIDVYAKITEELAEVKTSITASEQLDELGDLLFAVVNLVRWSEMDAETALREANLKFERRFRLVEQMAEELGQALDMMNDAERDMLWEQAKQRLGKG